VQIDGDDALTLPVSIGLAPGAVRLLRPAWGWRSRPTSRPSSRSAA